MSLSSVREENRLWSILLVVGEAGNAVAVVHLEHLSLEFALLTLRAPVVVRVENPLRDVHPVAGDCGRADRAGRGCGVREPRAGLIGQRAGDGGRQTPGRRWEP